jgi:hypothetical protein
MCKLAKVAGLALAMLVLPTAAGAQFQLGARIGYAIPGGSIFQNLTLQNFTASQVPIELDLGYRFTPAFSLTLYAAYAPGTVGSFIKDGCASFGSTCATHGVDIGLAAAWNFAPQAGMQPWLGARLGSEALYVDEKNGGVTTTLSANALAFGLEGGLDFGLGAFNLGPYLSLTTAKFSKLKVAEEITDIPSDQRTWHNWFTIGARALFTF